MATHTALMVLALAQASAMLAYSYPLPINIKNIWLAFVGLVASVLLVSACFYSVRLAGESSASIWVFFGTAFGTMSAAYIMGTFMAHGGRVEGLVRAR